MTQVIPTSSLRAFFDGYLDDAPIAFVVSTSGDATSRYVRANHAYLQLCGRTWTQVAGGDLVAKGSAVRTAERARRLWLLDNIGRYKNEVASIKHADGRMLSVSISAQRQVIDGVALDFEFIVPLPVESKPDRDARPSLPVAARTEPRSAHYKPGVAASLRSMDEEKARLLVKQMLTVVVHGLICLSVVLPPQHPICVCLDDLIKRHIRPAGDSAMRAVPADAFADLKRETLDALLLWVAGRIWIMARFQPEELRSKLETLVSPFTDAPIP